MVIIGINATELNRMSGINNKKLSKEEKKYRNKNFIFSIINVSNRFWI
jgi:hypothetical protein